MEWKVKNALSRDVEREHLNKILKDIQSRYKELADKTSVSSSTPSPSPPVVSRTPVTITLTGDVTGSATGTGQVTIQTELADGLTGIGDAPDDGSVYWRGSQQWQEVPLALQFFYDLTGEGLLSINADGVLTPRAIEGTTQQIAVADGDGVNANPVVSLADLPNSGTAPGIVYRYTRDSKGRISGDQAATTTHLPEGDNLYFTNARASAAAPIQNVLAGTGVTIDYTTPATPVINASVQRMPTRTVSQLTDATADLNLIIRVTDAPGGEAIAYSDGTTYRRISDQSPVIP